MIDPQEFAMLDAGASQYLSELKRAQQKTQPKKKKNLLLDQISTVGGIAGGIAGLPLGLIGAGGGAAVGSGLGEALENALTGDSLGKNVVKETALGGLFGAGPWNLAKAGFGAARGGARAAAGAATEEATKTGTRGRLTDLSNKLLTSQYGTIGKPVARATRPEETLGTLANYGLTKPDDVERVASKFTGSGGLVSKAVSKATGRSQRVPTEGIQQVFDDAVEINGLVDKDASAAQSVFRAQMKKLMGGPGGSLRPDADPTDVLGVMRALEKRAANLSGKGGNYRLSTPERVDQAKVLLTVRDELEDRLFAAAGASKSLATVLTPQFRKELVDLQPGNRQWQNFVDNTVMKSKDIGELRSTMSPFVRARQIIDEADVNTTTYGGRVGNLAGATAGVFDPLTGALTSALQTAARSPVARAASSGLRTVGNATSGQARSGTSPIGIGTRLGAAGAVGGFINQSGQASASPASLEDAVMGQTGTSMGGRFAPEPQSFPQPSDDVFDPSNVQNSIQQIVANGGTIDDVIKFTNVATNIQKLRSQGQPKEAKLTSTQQKDAVRAQNALKDVETLRGAIESGDITRTAIPGSGTALGGRILGTTDVEAALYNIGDVILRARTGATAPPEEVKRFVSGLLPRGGESRESQMNKLERAYRELVGMLNPPAALEDEQPTSMEDALLQTQGLY